MLNLLLDEPKKIGKHYSGINNLLPNSSPLCLSSAETDTVYTNVVMVDNISVECVAKLGNK